MSARRTFITATALGAQILLAVSACTLTEGGAPPVTAGAPTFQVDPFWPKPLPNNWILGQVAGVAVDSRDHVWIVHRPGSLTPEEAGAVQVPPISECCVPAPSVIEFDAEGNVVQAWGGPDMDGWVLDGEHGIFVDHQDNIWIGSSGGDVQVVQKFTP
ncbi:MAG: hypothetical protein KAJ42_12875, partial [Gemmatimonadetes bacterium]|nr:hypothetical protein [Gemmatimonadota bacterium]